MCRIVIAALLVLRIATVGIGYKDFLCFPVFYTKYRLPVAFVQILLDKYHSPQFLYMD
jgi:hypothetical protein